MSDRIEYILKYARQSAEAIDRSLNANAAVIAEVASAICMSIHNGGKVLLFGNGGSAADAQHLAAELVNRYRMDRRELPGLALTTDSSVITSISNDFGYDQIFAKQVRALAKKGDIALGLSTSGTSKSVLLGLKAAKKIGAVTVGICGSNASAMAPLCNFVLSAAESSTPIIQQVHITMGHLLCDLVEKELFNPDSK